MPFKYFSLPVNCSLYSLFISIRLYFEIFIKFLYLYFSSAFKFSSKFPLLCFDIKFFHWNLIFKFSLKSVSCASDTRKLISHFNKPHKIRISDRSYSVQRVRNRFIKILPVCPFPVISIHYPCERKKYAVFGVIPFVITIYLFIAEIFVLRAASFNVIKRTVQDMCVKKGEGKRWKIVRKAVRKRCFITTAMENEKGGGKRDDFMRFRGSTRDIWNPPSIPVWFQLSFITSAILYDFRHMNLIRGASVTRTLTGIDLRRRW